MGLHLNSELTNLPSLVIQLVQCGSLSLLPASRPHAGYHTCPGFTWGWGSIFLFFQFLCLVGKHFTCSTIFPNLILETVSLINYAVWLISSMDLPLSIL